MKLNDEMIDATIVGKAFANPTPRMTICILTLRNGFEIVGQSSCADASEFDRELGQKYAYDDAREQIWQFEGYLLRQRIFEGRA